MNKYDGNPLEMTTHRRNIEAVTIGMTNIEVSQQSKVKQYQIAQMMALLRLSVTPNGPAALFVRMLDTGTLQAGNGKPQRDTRFWTSPATYDDWNQLWREFGEFLCPPGTIEITRKQLSEFKQNAQTIDEYAIKFLDKATWLRSAQQLHDGDRTSDKTLQDWFRTGLNSTTLQQKLIGAYHDNITNLVATARQLSTMSDIFKSKRVDINITQQTNARNQSDTRLQRDQRTTSYHTSQADQHTQYRQRETRRDYGDKQDNHPQRDRRTRRDSTPDSRRPRNRPRKPRDCNLCPNADHDYYNCPVRGKLVCDYCTNRYHSIDECRIKQREDRESTTSTPKSEADSRDSPKPAPKSESPRRERRGSS